MKTKVIYNDEKKEKPFPKLMITDGGTLVYFKSPCVGQCLANNAGGDSSSGDISYSWLMGTFKDFNGKITLEND